MIKFGYIYSDVVVTCRAAIACILELLGLRLRWGRFYYTWKLLLVSDALKRIVTILSSYTIGVENATYGLPFIYACLISNPDIESEYVLLV
jgi:hypothetical protein